MIVFAGTITAACASALAVERAPLPSEAPMEACPEQGAGFGRIPGTSTCIRLSGRVAAGVDAGTGRGRVRPPTTVPVQGRVAIDARGDSEYGPVRSFVRIGAGRY